MTAYWATDVDFPRERLASLGVPDVVIDRIAEEVADLKSRRDVGGSPTRRDQIAESDAFASDLRKLIQSHADTSRETRQKISAHARPKTDLPLRSFIAAATAYLAGAEHLSNQLKSDVGGRVRVDEPRFQRRLASRIRRIFEEFEMQLDAATKGPFVLAIAIGLESMGIAGGEPVKYAKDVLKETSSKKRD